MHKSAMQMQHARDIQRNGAPLSGSGSGIGGEIKPHQCQQCLKSFSSNHQLVQHIRVHTGEKPYKCTYCDRRFKQLSHVQQHTRLHTGERPYKCHLPECGRAFIQLSNLQQHLRNHDAQVERAKNRPFHCNICGKGFATESSLRTHTSKELQLHLGVLQQHAALIGGPNATSCLICHKLFLGADALMEHMKHHHKQEAPPSSAVPTPPAADANISPNDQFNLAKRSRQANHPCPVCGKSYVNEGSLRKHLACHPETSQLASNLRMWPCSVCQAVFTHEAGLLTHMDHLRMDPKHQFAAQYMLSRAFSSRDQAVGGSSLLSIGQNSRGASPAHSDTSSCNGRLSSSPLPPQNNDNHNHGVNDNVSDNNNNTNGTPSNLSGNYNGKQHTVNDSLLNLRNQTSGNLYQQSIVAAANAITAAQNHGLQNSPGPTTSAAQAVVNSLAAAMRQNQPMTGNQQSSPSHFNQNNLSMGHHGHQPQQHQHHGLVHHHGSESDVNIRISDVLRTQAEAALRLAVSQVVHNSQVSNNNGNDPSQYRHHSNGVSSYNHQSGQQFSPDLSRLEQAMRLHGGELGIQNQNQP